MWDSRKDLLRSLGKTSVHQDQFGTFKSNDHKPPPPQYIGPKIEFGYRVCCSHDNCPLHSAEQWPAREAGGEIGYIAIPWHNPFFWLLQIRECHNSSNDDWCIYMLSTQRTQRLRVSETDDTFSEDLYEGSEFHSTLYHMIKDYSNPDAIDRLKHSHHLFVDCVQQLLSMTRVLTYS